MGELISIVDRKRPKRYSAPRGEVVTITLYEDLLSNPLNALRVQFQLKEWRDANRKAKPDPDNPDTWDWYALDSLDRDYERAFLP